MLQVLVPPAVQLMRSPVAHLWSILTVSSIVDRSLSADAAVVAVYSARKIADRVAIDFGS